MLPGITRAGVCLMVLLLVLLLLAPAAPAAAQTVGTICGPEHAAASFKWTRIADISATKGSTVAPGSGGCATSDASPFAHLSVSLPGSFLIRAIAMTLTKEPGLKKGLDILVGNANSTAYVEELGAGNVTLGQVLTKFVRCTKRASLPADGRTTLQCNEDVLDSGYFITIIASSLKVCDVLVCAQQELYASDGTALTRSAALQCPASGRGNLSTSVADPMQDVNGVCQGVWLGQHHRCPGQPGLWQALAATG
jgi:hypothetical protein